MSELNDSGFGDSSRPRGRRKLERKAEVVDQNVVLNVALKALNILSTALIAVGIWHIKDLREEIKETRLEVRNVAIAVGKVESSTNELTVRMRALEDYRRDDEVRGREIERRVTTNETDIKHLQGRK